MSRVIVPPHTITIDGAEVRILSVTKHEWLGGEARYIVSCYVKWGGWRSRVFSLDVSSNRELREKLRAEIAKMKLMLLSGENAPFERV